MTPTEKCILMIDDDEQYLEYTSEILEAEGFKVLTATSWPKALRHLHEKPTMALVDLHMQTTMEGDELSSILKKNHKSMKVVLISSDDLEVLKRAASKHNLDGYISKGLPSQTMLRKVQRFLEA